MLKRTITYDDYNGVEKTEDFYFALRESDIVMLNSSVEGGFEQKLNRIIQTKDGNQIMKEFKNIILLSYGEKSPDGRRFVQNEELSKEFQETPAYDKLFMELVTDADKAAAFIRGILPEKISQQLDTNEEKPAALPAKK